MDQEQQTSPTSRVSDSEHDASPRESTVTRARRAIDSVPWGRRALVIGAVVVALVALVFFLQWLNSGEQSRGGRQRFGGPQPVGVMKVAQGPMPISLNALGTVTPLATVTVRPQVSGQLLSFNFTEGQTVKAGDVLAEIDPSTFKAALDQAKGQLARDRAALANSITDAKRYRELWAQKAIAQQQLATQEALVKQNQGVVAADEANVKLAQLNLDYTHVTSPIAGRAGIRLVDVGNLVQAGQATGIVVVTQMAPMSVLFSIPEDNIDRVISRMNTGEKLETTAFDRTQSRKLATGTLSAVDSTIDTTTGTVKLRAMFDNAKGELFPNQFVNVHLLIDTLQNQTLVPNQAIQRGSQGAFVYVVNADKTVHMRAIKIGMTDGTNTVVTSGLKPGDTIVVDGADRLKDGAEVSIPNPTSGPITAPSAAPAGEAQPTGGGRGGRGEWMERYMKTMPAELQAKLRAMSRDERRQWFRDHESEYPRPQRGGGGRGGGGGGGGGE